MVGGRISEDVGTTTSKSQKHSVLHALGQEILSVPHRKACQEDDFKSVIVGKNFAYSVGNTREQLSRGTMCSTIILPHVELSTNARTV